jgi:thioredoxin-dependent peroxiredoxin
MPTKAEKSAKPVRKAPARKPAAKRGAAPAAPPERAGLIELAGKPATVVGDDVRVGQAAPHFTAQVGSWVGLNTWDEADPLEATSGKVRILTALPSLDTSVCDTETRRFNEAAASLGDDIRVIAVSMDLPIAQKRWCGAAGVERVMVVSDHLAGEFGVKYGTLIKERRWFRRAVFVVGKDDRLHYVAYMPRLGDEPNYEEVLAAAKQLLAA